MSFVGKQAHKNPRRGLGLERLEDRLAMAVEPVSTSAAGVIANNFSSHASISEDGRYIAFFSYGNNLVPNDVNTYGDIFVKDMDTGAILLASTTSAGAQQNLDSGQPARPAISADGRYVAFITVANNLVASDTNSITDVFVKDTVTGAVELASANTAGGVGNDGSDTPAISSDGRYVAFHSHASNLVSGDQNFRDDVFRRDLLTDTTVLVSRASDGAQGSIYSWLPSISGDGRLVVFASAAVLTPDDSPFHDDVFLRNVPAGTTQLTSVKQTGAAPDRGSSRPAISGNGLFVAFESDATDLTPNDTNNTTDIFVKNLATGAVTRVSTTSQDGQASGPSARASISADGRYVAFQSTASNLVAGDTNGVEDVFVKDLVTGELKRISDANGGNWPSISANGAYVVYSRRVTSLDPGTQIYRGAVLEDNTPPTIGPAPANQILLQGDETTLQLNVADNLTSPTALTVTATSSNPVVIPQANLQLGVSGAARTVRVTAPANQTGVSTITITVQDAAGNSASLAFDVTVRALDPARPWHNTAVASNVDRSGGVDAADILWTMYYYGLYPTGALPARTPGAPLVDVVPDGVIDPQDILQTVFDFQAAAASGEGEAEVTAVEDSAEPNAAELALLSLLFAEPPAIKRKR